MEYEACVPLFHIRRIVGMAWDALGETLVLQVELAHPNDAKPPLPVALSLDPAAVRQLHDVLPQALADRPGEAPPRQ